MISHDRSTALCIGVLDNMQSVLFLCTETAQGVHLVQSHFLCTLFANAVNHSGKVGLVGSEGRAIALYMCVLDALGGRGGEHVAETLCHIQYMCACLPTNSTYPSLVPQVLLILGLRCLSSCELLSIVSRSSILCLGHTLFCVCEQ